MSRVLGVSRSGYYAWLVRPESARSAIGPKLPLKAGCKEGRAIRGDQFRQEIEVLLAIARVSGLVRYFGKCRQEVRCQQQTLVGRSAAGNVGGEPLRFTGEL